MDRKFEDDRSLAVYKSIIGRASCPNNNLLEKKRVAVAN